MKKIVSVILFLFPVLTFAQTVDTTGGDTLQLVNATRAFKQGDTIINILTLNIGVQGYQIPEESRKILKANGLDILEKDTVIIDKKNKPRTRIIKALVVLKDTSLIKKDFSFFIKTYTDNDTNYSKKEWFENKVEIKVKNNDIYYIQVTTDQIEMANRFHMEGKIYVVVAVSMILFFTIIFYLVYLERKTKRLEKQLKDK